MSTIKGIIYDFDGVIADSEALANAVLAEFVTGLGLPTTLQDSYDRYMGKRAAEVQNKKLTFIRIWAARSFFKTRCRSGGNPPSTIKRRGR